MKAKKLLALVLTLCLVISLFPMAYAAEEADPLSFADAEKSVLTPKLDGKDIKVDMYEDVYCANPNREEDQKIAIYVPEGATADSPIIKAPTMPIVWPTGLGSLIPASRRSSNIKIITKASKKAEKGTPCLEAIIE